MESLVGWIKRLATVKPSEVALTKLRIFVPGHQVMNFDKWLITTEQPRPVPPGYRFGSPESMALLSYLDATTYAQNALHHQRLSVDLAAAMSLALERRIAVPYEMAAQIKGHTTGTFLPLGVITDRVVNGPLPKDPFTPISEFFRKAVGLPNDDLAAIGAAVSMFHGAILLHENDVRSAYTLLVAGIETLSRRYGQPPLAWDAWEISSGWDAVFIKQGFSTEQSDACRKVLMEDRQLRLKATFRSYASLRLRESFWDEPWVEWMYPLEMPQGTWGAPEKMHEGRVRDFLPIDRTALGKALGYSYDLRSSYVHRGSWFGPLELTLNPSSQIDVARPLPFAALRAVLRELILTELDSRTHGGELPDVKLEREWQPAARDQPR